MDDTFLVLGASGLLGHQVFLEAKRRHGDRVHGTYRSMRSRLKGISHLHTLDCLDFKQLETFILKLKPSVLINCAGIVKRLCDDPYEAVMVNAALPHFLAKHLDRWEGRLLQLSTDCVFSGKKGNYSEADHPDADDLYGRSKLMGEVCRAPHLTIRTSFIGHELETNRGLLAWFLGQKGLVQGYRGVRWSGVTNLYAANVLMDLSVRKDITGLLNLSGETVDKYILLCMMAEIFNKKDVTIQPVDVPVEDKSLINHRLTEYGFKVPFLKKMIEELKDLN